MAATSKPNKNNYRSFRFQFEPVSNIIIIIMITLSISNYWTLPIQFAFTYLTSEIHKKMETINTNSKYPENHFLDSIKVFYSYWKYGASLLNSNHTLIEFELKIDDAKKPDYYGLHLMVIAPSQITTIIKVNLLIDCQPVH